MCDLFSEAPRTALYIYIHSSTFTHLNFNFYFIAGCVMRIKDSSYGRKMAGKTQHEG